MSELFLVGDNGVTAKVHKPLTLSRDWCRIFGDAYKYVAHEQFKTSQTAHEWRISGCKPSTPSFNPTFLNEKNITGVEEGLTNADIIRIGKLTLRVQLIQRFPAEGDVQTDASKEFKFE